MCEVSVRDSLAFFSHTKSFLTLFMTPVKSLKGWGGGGEGGCPLNSVGFKLGPPEKEINQFKGNFTEED